MAFQKFYGKQANGAKDKFTWTYPYASWPKILGKAVAACEVEIGTITESGQGLRVRLD